MYFVLSSASSFFNPTLSISLLHESFHLVFSLPLRLFSGTHLLLVIKIIHKVNQRSENNLIRVNLNSIRIIIYKWLSAMN